MNVNLLLCVERQDTRQKTRDTRHKTRDMLHAAYGKSFGWLWHVFYVFRTSPRGLSPRFESRLDAVDRSLSNFKNEVFKREQD